ncbi:MAG: bifunctional N-acetylglucosamine-1-phosphate uridyltransferase/glucosamine-1-phosphate acetyltransferase [Burkholderiaceae bacterium]|nr:bifunctional N-acetylglucosamine-1-phosphate uridyltransferase/glucosamine-1-phosphate acetyltransferase [Burkholderiaceae bacterium]
MNIVILAAGQGKRMKSALPKVLQPLAGKPLLQHVLETALALAPKAEPIVVIGHGAEQVQSFLVHLASLEVGFRNVKTVLQKEQKGTGHALLQALPKLNRLLPTLVLYGDVPLCSKETLKKLVRLSDGAVGLLTHRMQNPHGYGRIVRDIDGNIDAVNSRSQLAELERVLQHQLAHALLENGVTLFDPHRIDVRGELNCGKDVWIDVGCIFEGAVTLADKVRIGPYCVIKDTQIGEGAAIEAFSHLDGAKIGPANRIGPYARIRPGAELGSEVHIGNFVEVKNSRIAAQTKANHLAYVGDSIVGSRVNIGAGTITCNYDGVNKHQTVIEDDVFIGSDTQLVAPVKVGKGATLGAGTTLTKDAPSGKLTVSRAKQISIDWQRPTKAKSGSPKIKKTSRK